MLVAGQKLWLVPRERYIGGPREVSVVKVGRKWAEIDVRGYRIDKDSLFIYGNGYTSPGRCYLSRDDFEASDRLERSWLKLRGFIDRQYRAPDGLTLENLQEAARLLRVDVSTTDKKA